MMGRELESDRDTASAIPGKEKPSRLARHRREEARFRKRLAFSMSAILVVAFCVGSLLDLPVLNFPRGAWRWLRERVASSGGNEGGETESYLFQVHPQSGKVLGDTVSVLLGVTGNREAGDGEDLLYLALFTFHLDRSELEVYVIPEMLMAYDASGKPVRLRESLRGEKGEDLLRSTVGNLSGTVIDYLVLCDFREAVLVAQSLGLPPVLLEEEAHFLDPLTGERQSVLAGQRIGDADRLLYHLLATDRPDYWDGYFQRVERLRGYLPRALQALSEAEGGEALESLLGHGGRTVIVPGNGSASRDAAYVASMLKAATRAAGQEIPCRGVPRVEVLNGCGVPELGRKVGWRLADLGIPLGDTGRNAKTVVNGEEVNDFSHQESLIICRSMDPKVKAFARYLGVQLSVREVREEPGAGEEVVVIAGRDLST